MSNSSLNNFEEILNIFTKFQKKIFIPRVNNIKLYTGTFYVALCGFLLFILVSCGIVDKFDEKFGIPKSPSRENIQYKTQTFNTDLKKYYTGPQSIKIGMQIPQKNFVLEDSLFLDPHKIILDSEIQLAHLLFATITTLDFQTGSPAPMLAKSWQIKKTSNEFTYIFTLRDLLWSDGQELTAEQVKASLLRSFDPRTKNPFVAQLAWAIKGGDNLYSLPKSVNHSSIKKAEQEVQIKVQDSKTLHITVSSQEINLLEALAHPSTAILPITDSQATDTSLFIVNSSWLGIGAFIPIDIPSDTSYKTIAQTNLTHTPLHLIARPDFWSKPWLTNIDIIFVESSDEQIKMYNTGELDWITLPYEINSSKTNPHNDINENKNIQKIEFATQIVINIPKQSLLRNTQDSTQNNLEAPDIQQFLNYLIEGLNKFQKEQSNISVFNANSIFMPNMVFFTKKNMQTLEKINNQTPQKKSIFPKEIKNIEEFLTKKTLPITKTSNQTTPQNTQKKQPLTTTQYASKLKQLLSNTNRKTKQIRLGYTHSFLLPYAQHIVSLFKNYNINVKLVPNLSSIASSTRQYDIAIRQIPIKTNSTESVFSYYYWRFLIDEYLVSSHKPHNIQMLLDDLKHSNKALQYLTILHKIEQEVVGNLYMIPLWNLPKRELIDIKKYSWWTPQVSWHPLFP